MADRNHPNTAPPVDLADDDPFAELTRIMGFDPRQPAKAAPPADNQDSAAGIAEDADDFSIDLEKEMMGEFGSDEHNSVASAPRADEPAGFGDIERDLAAQFDDAMSADELENSADEPEMSAAPEIAAPDMDAAPEVAARESAAVDDAGMDFDFDEAFLTAVEDDEFSASDTAEPEIAPFDTAASENAAPDYAGPEVAAVDAEAEPDLQGELDHAPAAESDYAPAVEIDHAMDAAQVPAVDRDPGSETDFSAADDVDDIELDFDHEFAASLAEESEPDSGSTDEPVAAVEAGEAFAAPEPVGEDEMAAGFDAAMLDAGIDDETVATEEENPPSAEPPAVAELSEETALPEETAIVEDEELHLSHEDFDAVEEEPLAADAPALEAAPDETMDDPLEAALPVFPSRPVEYQSAEAVDAGPVEEEPREAADNSLEDELNALLGNISSASVAASGHTSRPEAAPVGAPAFAINGYQAAGHQVTGHHADLELDWDIGEADLLAETDSEPVQAFQPETAAYESEDDFDTGVQAVSDGRWSVAHDDGRTGPDLVDVPDFDHDDLDVAFANAMSVSAAQPDDSQADWRQPESEPAPRQTGSREDPLDVIAALTAEYSAPVSAAFGRTNTRGQQVEDAPDIETIEVQDKAVALADDLDLPEPAYDEEPSPVADYDDLDTEFASLLSDMNASDAVAPEASAARADGAYGLGRDDIHAPAAVLANHDAAATHAAYDDDARGGEYGYDETLRYAADTSYPEAEADELEYDPDFDEAVAAPGMEAERAPPRRGMLIAAIVGGVAIVGGLGAFAMSFGGGSGDDAPVLVRADDAPIKVKPANPGGATVPNQDNKVYDTVAGTGSTADPQQEKLVTTAEEPVDMTPPAPEPELVDLAPVEAGSEPAPDGEDRIGQILQAAGEPAPKGEDRIEQILQEAEADLDTRVAAIAPRKVRTMVVKPDGTLVPREDPTPFEAVEPRAAAATEALAEPAAAAPAVAPSAPDVLAGTPSFTPPADAAAGALAPAPAQTPAQPAEVPAAQQAAFPDSVPIAPTRPSEQPVDVVGEVKPDQVAALSPAAASAGNWSMQIASQPSEAAAQSSYQDLLSRYGSVLNGRQANIVKAEIAGKGTFWRVRVPAQSRNDAISLCESYKAAGGNCFVSR